jgi:hypothetical protein
MRMLTIVCILTLVCMAVSGCGGGDKGVAGKYVSEKYPDDYRLLTADGTFEDSSFGVKRTGTWALSGDKLQFKLPSGRTAEVTVSGDTLVDPDGEVWKKRP